MSKVMKVLVGIPIKGTTISRQMKAVKKAGYIQLGCAAAGGAGIASGIALSNALTSAIGGIGFIAGNFNVLGFWEEYKSLKPKYDEVLSRAKQIFKK